MLVEDQLTRMLSSKLSKSVKELYSADSPLDVDTYNNAMKVLEEAKNRPLFYVDNVGTVKEIVATVIEFANNRIIPNEGKGLVVTIDHVLLTKGKQGDSEKEIVDELMRTLIILKKYFASIGVKVIFFVLSQLNREIEKEERTTNALLHYPTKNDIFAASSVYYCSDYVMITHKPSGINGIGKYYGPKRAGYPNGLPTKCPEDENRSMVYWHVIKERFGEHKILSMVENFKNSCFEEYDLIK